jgi:hypothetical protein
MHGDRKDEKGRGSEEWITPIVRGEHHLEHPAGTEHVLQAVGTCSEDIPALSDGPLRIVRTQQHHILIGKVLKICGSYG